MAGIDAIGSDGFPRPEAVTNRQPTNAGCSERSRARASSGLPAQTYPSSATAHRSGHAGSQAAAASGNAGASASEVTQSVVVPSTAVVDSFDDTTASVAPPHPTAEMHPASINALTMGDAYASVHSRASAPLWAPIAIGARWAARYRARTAADSRQSWCRGSRSPRSQAASATRQCSAWRCCFPERSTASSTT